MRRKTATVFVLLILGVFFIPLSHLPVKLEIEETWKPISDEISTSPFAIYLLPHKYQLIFLTVGRWYPYAVPMKIRVSDLDGNLVFERIQTELPFENVVFKVEKTGNYTISLDGFRRFEFVLLKVITHMRTYYPFSLLFYAGGLFIFEGGLATNLGVTKNERIKK